MIVNFKKNRMSFLGQNKFRTVIRIEWIKSKSHIWTGMDMVWDLSQIEEFKTYELKVLFSKTYYKMKNKYLCSSLNNIYSNIFRNKIFWSKINFVTVRFYI
jgi:hypothetical protein